MAWNRSNPTDKANSRSPVGRARRNKALLGISVFFGLTLIGFLAWRVSPVREHETVKPKNLKRVHSSAARAAMVNDGSQLTTANVATAGQEVVENQYARKYPGEKILSILTNANGFVQVETLAPNGRTTLHVLSKPSIFKHATDEMILAVLNTSAAHEAPPLPNLGGRRADLEFRRSLKEPIVDLPEDSERTKAYKEIVRSAREEILARMENGEHFADILQDHRQLANENGKIRRNALRELRALQNAGDDAGANAYASSVNGVFKKMGIAPIDLNETPQRKVR